MRFLQGQQRLLSSLSTAIVRTQAVSTVKPNVLLTIRLCSSHTHSHTSEGEYQTKWSSKNSLYGALGAAVVGMSLCINQSLQFASNDAKEKSSSEPVYTQAEIASHTSEETGIWVTYKDGVYDITEFVANHPGGRDKIMLAAGKAIDPFWNLYRQHFKDDTATDILKELRIGRLNEVEAQALKDQMDSNNPYSKDPPRHPALLFHSTQPCNAELPVALMDSWITPAELFFVRHHHPVPACPPQEYNLKVTGPAGATLKEYSLHDLQTKFTKHQVTATLQCGGNRRADMNALGKTSGTPWGVGALSTACWGGARLSDVLADAGVSPTDPQVAHIQFIAADEMTASIPVEKANNPYGDVLLAWEMNGHPIPPDHGAPVRAVVPGHVGVRNVKWVQEVVARVDEADGMWQRGMAYKLFPPSIKSLEGVDVESRISMQELPVQSAITSPTPGTVVQGPELEVQGYAWSGGGHAIANVEVTVNDGASWHVARLTEGHDQPKHRAWAWTFWTVDVPISELAAGDKFKVCCRATDIASNTQPASVEPIWNLRGLSNNSWHSVSVTLDED